MTTKFRDKKKSFTVVTDACQLHTSHETEEAAQSACEQANRQAKELGLEVQYSVSTQAISHGLNV